HPYTPHRLSLPTRRSSDLDTGSDQFNAAVGNDAEATPGKTVTYYSYGDGTYGYSLQKTGFKKLSYFGKNDTTSPVKVRNGNYWRSEEHTSELQSRENLVCR